MFLMNRYLHSYLILNSIKKMNIEIITYHEKTHDNFMHFVFIKIWVLDIQDIMIDDCLCLCRRLTFPLIIHMYTFWIFIFFCHFLDGYATGFIKGYNMGWKDGYEDSGCKGTITTERPDPCKSVLNKYYWSACCW